MNSSASPEDGSPPSNRKRVRNFTADDRAVHRQVEKSRREAFRHRLTTLASLLPDLADLDPKKLSKHNAVDSAIARLQQMSSRLSAAQIQIQALQTERDELLAELNLIFPDHQRTARPLLPETIQSSPPKDEPARENPRAAPPTLVSDGTSPEDHARIAAAPPPPPRLNDNELGWEQNPADGFDLSLWNSLDSMSPAAQPVVSAPIERRESFLSQPMSANEAAVHTLPHSNTFDEPMLVLPDDWTNIPVMPQLAQPPLNWSQTRHHSFA